MLGAVFNRLYGTKLTDVTYGYLAFWRRYLSELMPSGSGFDVEASMLTSAALKGLPIVEVPCHEGRRLYGESKLRPFRDGSRILRHQLGAWWDARRRPAATVT